MSVIFEVTKIKNFATNKIVPVLNSLETETNLDIRQQLYYKLSTRLGNAASYVNNQAMFEKSANEPV